MLSIDQIVSMAKEQGVKARCKNIKPYLLKKFDVDHFETFPFPNIGDYTPKGWELVEYKTCDKTGWGSEYEPALTVNGLLKWIKNLQKADENYAMAIIEEGEFQVVIGLFKPDSRDFTHSGEMTENEMRIVGGRK